MSPLHGSFLCTMNTPGFALGCYLFARWGSCIPPSVPRPPAPSFICHAVFAFRRPNPRASCDRMVMLPRANAPESQAGGVPSPQRGVVVAAIALVAGIAACYSNSFGGPFVYDDTPSIVDNVTLRRLWPIWVPLSPPAGGFTVSGRPVLNLSFALNYAISGTQVWSYHGLNLAIHAAAALALF